MVQLEAASQNYAKKMFSTALYLSKYRLDYNFKYPDYKVKLWEEIHTYNMST